MNKYEMHTKFQLDWTHAMVEYGNQFAEGEERNNALWNWARNELANFKAKWELENGKLEEI